MLLLPTCEPGIKIEFLHSGERRVGRGLGFVAVVNTWNQEVLDENVIGCNAGSISIKFAVTVPAGNFFESASVQQLLGSAAHYMLYTYDGAKVGVVCICVGGRSVWDKLARYVKDIMDQKSLDIRDVTLHQTQPPPVFCSDVEEQFFAVHHKEKYEK